MRVLIMRRLRDRQQQNESCIHKQIEDIIYFAQVKLCGGAFGNDALSRPLVESLRFKMLSHRMYGDKDTHAGFRTGTITVLELVQ